jgi:hypothetical protein
MSADHTPDDHASLLRKLAVPIPCTASWDAMQGDERVRHCGLCRKSVYNLSAMPQADAAALLAANADGGVCVRFYRRSDGTVMTSDCGASPRVMLHRALRTLPRAAAGAAGVASAAAVAVAVAHAKAPQLHAALDPYMVAISIDRGPGIMPPTIGLPIFVAKPDHPRQASRHGVRHAARHAAAPDDPPPSR